MDLVSPRVIQQISPTFPDQEKVDFVVRVQILPHWPMPAESILQDHARECLRVELKRLAFEAEEALRKQIHEKFAQSLGVEP